jgi:hypothetical protein
MNSFNARTSASVLIFASGVLLVTCLVWGDGVYFSHRIHLNTGLYCPDCHASADTSTRAEDNNIPLLDVCGSCHDPIPEVALTASLEREIIFAHESHIKAAAACTLCHTLETESENARMQLPSMATCISCHQSQKKTEVCSDCHTGLGSPDLIPRSHTREWIIAHEEDARLSEDYCANCHDQAFCQDCHQGDNIEPRPHRRNWIYTHSIGARKGIWECADCHEITSQFKCVSCHQSPLGRPSSHRRGSWVRDHGDGAELNPSSCVTCHLNVRSDPLCILCHDD